MLSRWRVAVGLSIWLSAPANAGAEIRFTHFAPFGHASRAGLDRWADSLARESAGRLTVAVIGSGRIGSARDHYDLVRLGKADAGWIVPGYTPGRFPIVSLLEYPFLVKDAVGGTEAFDRWYRRYAATEMRDVRYCLGFLQEPGAIHSVDRIASPADLRGKVLRSPTAPLKEFFELVGAHGVEMAVSDVLPSLEKRTIDGAALPWASAISFGVADAATYHLDAPFYTVPVIYAINSNFYDDLELDLKRILDAHCSPHWASIIAADWASRERLGRSALLSMPTHSVIRLSPQETRQWHDAALPLLSRWTSKVSKLGVDGQIALQSLYRLLLASKAAYRDF